MADANLEIDGVIYDAKFTRAIIILSDKYQFSRKEVASACVFFNDLMILEWHRVTDIFLRSCKNWKVSPIEALNNGIMVYLDTCNEKNLN